MGIITRLEEIGLKVVAVTSDQGRIVCLNILSLFDPLQRLQLL